MARPRRRHVDGPSRDQPGMMAFAMIHDPLSAVASASSDYGGSDDNDIHTNNDSHDGDDAVNEHLDSALLPPPVGPGNFDEVDMDQFFDAHHDIIDEHDDGGVHPHVDVDLLDASAGLATPVKDVDHATAAHHFYDSNQYAAAAAAAGNGGNSDAISFSPFIPEFQNASSSAAGGADAAVAALTPTSGGDPSPNLVSRLDSVNLLGLDDNHPENRTDSGGGNAPVGFMDFFDDEDGYDHPSFGVRGATGGIIPGDYPDGDASSDDEDDQDDDKIMTFEQQRWLYEQEKGIERARGGLRTAATAAGRIIRRIVSRIVYEEDEPYLATHLPRSAVLELKREAAAAAAAAAADANNNSDDDNANDTLPETAKKPISPYGPDSRIEFFEKLRKPKRKLHAVPGIAIYRAIVAAAAEKQQRARSSSAGDASTGSTTDTEGEGGANANANANTSTPKLNSGPWTVLELDQMYAGFAQYGKDLLSGDGASTAIEKIAAYIPTRTEKQVDMYFHKSFKKRKRCVNPFVPNPEDAFMDVIIAKRNARNKELGISNTRRSIGDGANKSSRKGDSTRTPAVHPSYYSREPKSMLAACNEYLGIKEFKDIPQPGGFEAFYGTNAGKYVCGFNYPRYRIVRDIVKMTRAKLGKGQLRVLEDQDRFQSEIQLLDEQEKQQEQRPGGLDFWEFFYQYTGSKGKRAPPLRNSGDPSSSGGAGTNTPTKRKKKISKKTLDAAAAAAAAEADPSASKATTGKMKSKRESTDTAATDASEGAGEDLTGDDASVSRKRRGSINSNSGAENTKPKASPKKTAKADPSASKVTTGKNKSKGESIDAAATDPSHAETGQKRKRGRPKKVATENGETTEKKPKKKKVKIADGSEGAVEDLTGYGASVSRKQRGSINSNSSSQQRVLPYIPYVPPAYADLGGAATAGASFFPPQGGVNDLTNEELALLQERQRSLDRERHIQDERIRLLQLQVQAEQRRMQEQELQSRLRQLRGIASPGDVGAMEEV